jgi:hypothetical protein
LQAKAAKHSTAIKIETPAAVDVGDIFRMAIADCRAILSSRNQDVSIIGRSERNAEKNLQMRLRQLQYMDPLP